MAGVFIPPRRLRELLADLGYGGGIVLCLFELLMFLFFSLILYDGFWLGSFESSRGLDVCVGGELLPVVS